MWDRAFEHVRDGQNEILRRTQIHKISNETLAQIVSSLLSAIICFRDDNTLENLYGTPRAPDYETQRSSH